MPWPVHTGSRPPRTRELAIGQEHGESDVVMSETLDFTCAAMLERSLEKAGQERFAKAALIASLMAARARAKGEIPDLRVNHEQCQALVVMGTHYAGRIIDVSG